MSMDTVRLLAEQARYCASGESVHYTTSAKGLTGCDGRYPHADFITPFFDLPMWSRATLARTV